MPALQNTVTPRLSSLGVIDRYLSHSHDIPGGGRLYVSNPIITVSVSRASPIVGIMVGVHCFTWNGTFYACFSFPEAFLGGLNDQERNSRNGQTETVFGWSRVFMDTLTSLAK